jgi:hypothetical protein
MVLLSVPFLIRSLLFEALRPVLRPCGSGRRFNVGDQMGLILITGLGHVDFVPEPLGLPFLTKTSLWVIRRMNYVLGRRHVIGFAPGNLAILQRGILGLQLKSERRLPVNEVALLDGGSPSCLTYFRVVGLNPNVILAECFHHRYASMFILDQFPFQQDGVRFEDDATAALIGKWLFRDYSALGYRVVRVPILPVKDRLTFILETLSEQGLM